LKVFFQYSLRFTDRLKRQLLISHCSFPIKKWLTPEADREIKSALRLSHQFLFQCWPYIWRDAPLQAQNVGPLQGFGSEKEQPSSVQTGIQVTIESFEF
jgi:hypothetical protein